MTLKKQIEELDVRKKFVEKQIENVTEGLNFDNPDEKKTAIYHAAFLLKELKDILAKKRVLNEKLYKIRLDLRVAFNSYLFKEIGDGNLITNILTNHDWIVQEAADMGWSLPDIVMWYETGRQEHIHRFHKQRLENDPEFKTRMVMNALTDGELTQ